MDVLASLVPPDAWKPALLAGALLLPIVATVGAIIEPQLPMLHRPSLLLALVASLCALGVEGVNERGKDALHREQDGQIASLQAALKAANDRRAKEAADAAKRIQELEQQHAARPAGVPEPVEAPKAPPAADADPKRRSTR